MIVLDTNFIYALFMSNDSLNTRALEIFGKIDKRETIVVPYIVVAELLIAGSENNFVEACLTISKNNLVDFGIEDLEYVQNLEYKIRRKLKANDCILLAIAHRLEAELLTFDTKLNNTFNLLRD